ncbi:hypothetical protein LY76DRAFT_628920 [Colletotrichum caudatum]|nr:hypothetical protein LY76DRAFT_628920 [Colletotrichum caudatum]
MTFHLNTGCNVSRFPIIERPKVNRRHGPKTRTGCITCKKRHVRCDEGKPTCQNCAKSKKECEGYMAFSKEFTLFPSDLMTHLLPQIAREDPAIRHAAFAIGAATLGSDSRNQRTSGKGPFVKEAFQYHGRAISFILSSAEDKKSLPRALLSCLLFVTFEAIQGNNRAARTHINHGCIMLDQVMRQGIHKDCPPELIHEVMSSFRRLTLQSWNVKEYHPLESDTWVPWCCRGTRSRYAVDELPDLFRDISDARRWWEIVQHHIVTRTNMYLSLRFNGLPAPPATDHLSKEQMQRCMSILDRWRHGLGSLDVGAGPRQYQETREHLQVLSLKLLHLSFEIYVKTCQYINIEVLTAMTSSFRQIVSMSRRVLKGQSFVNRSKEVFTMESGLSWSLLTVSTYCADVKLRKEAQMLLREYPRRDGIWDTRLFAALSNMGQNTQTLLSGDRHGPFGAVLLNKDLVMYEDEGWRRAYGLVGGKWQIVDEERLLTGSNQV